MQLTTEGLDAETARVRFVPTLNAGSGEVMGFHRHLLADGVRTGAFVEAVRRAVRPADFVVDLGTGTGVLAVAAAQAGAGTVIGIERAAIATRARALAAANNVRVQVVQGASDHVRLPRLADVLVSECLGLAGLGGAMIGAVKRARDRWLKPGGIVIPKRVRVFAAPVEDPEADALVHCFDGARVAGVRLDVLGAHVGHNLYIASFADRHLLAPPVEVCGTDLQAGPLEDAVEGLARTTTTRPGTLHGWALWFEADLAGDLVLRTGPLDAPTVWEQCFAPVPAHRVEADTPIDLALRFRGRHAGLDRQPPDAEGVWIDWETAIDGDVRHGSTESSHGAPAASTRHAAPGDNPPPTIPEIGLSSMTVVPVTTQLARAMSATRAGWTLPAHQGPGVTGELFMQRMQAQIAERLDPHRLARYIAMRDAVREAVHLLSAGDGKAAGKAFEACAARLPDLAHDPELDDLARSWLDPAWAYHDMRREDPAAAGARLHRAMESDTRLEQVHGYGLMHIGRIHTVHLWLRVQAAGGAREAALDGTDAIVAYVNGFGSDLPLGTGWSKEAASRIPADLAAAMTCRVAGEVGSIVGGLDQEHSAKALDRLPALERLAPEVHDEITDWVRIKRAWSEGRTDEFLARALPYLGAGRRETCLWYAVLLDLCRVSRATRPDAARLFCAEVVDRAGEDPAVPRGLGREFERLAEETPAATWVATMPPRRFHLVCVGLPRSGVVSLFTLFHNFRAANEYAEAETIRTLVDHHRGRLSDDALRARLARRDRESALEMDANGFLHLAGDLLATLSDETRFVLPVRAPDAWFESYMKELVRVHDRLRARGKAPPAWQRDYGEMLLGGFDWEEIATPQARRACLPDVARRFLTHWAQATGKMLDTLPSERTLVLRTEDLGPMRHRLAAFVDQPVDSLTGAAHSNASPRGPGPLDDLPHGWLSRAAAEICGPTHARALKRCAG